MFSTRWLFLAPFFGRVLCFLPAQGNPSQTQNPAALDCSKEADGIELSYTRVRAGAEGTGRCEVTARVPALPAVTNTLQSI
jgi:hypothetical protein